MNDEKKETPEFLVGGRIRTTERDMNPFNPNLANIPCGWTPDSAAEKLDEPICPRCGETGQWRDCDSCNFHGHEDDCSECNGDGGRWVCSMGCDDEEDEK